MVIFSPVMASPRPRRSARARLLLPLSVLVAAGLLASGCGSSNKSGATTGNSASSAASTSKFESAGVLEPVREAPPLALKNYLGQPVNIASYRGKAVLVTFVYTHCPDVCPIMISNLHIAQRMLGKEASKVQIIAVSVDPKGDTPKTVAHFLAEHEQTGKMQYLIGSKKELAKAWQAWGVGAERDAGNPDLVEHSGLVYGITGSGKRLTIYSASFKPAEVAHDVPLLAAD
jgi:protein SCO1